MLDLFLFTFYFDWLAAGTVCWGMLIACVLCTLHLVCFDCVGCVECLVCFYFGGLVIYV